MNNQSKSETLSQLMTDLHAIRQQLAQVRKDLDRLEASHSSSNPKKAIKASNLEQTRVSRAYYVSPLTHY